MLSPLHEPATAFSPRLLPLRLQEHESAVVRELRPDGRLYYVTGQRQAPGVGGIGGKLGAAQLAGPRGMAWWDSRPGGGGAALLIADSSSAHRVVAASCNPPIRASEQPVYAPLCALEAPRGTVAGASAWAVLNAAGRQLQPGVNPLANATGSGSARDTPASSNLCGVAVDDLTGHLFVADHDASVVLHIRPDDASAPAQIVAGQPWRVSLAGSAPASDVLATATTLRKPTDVLVATIPGGNRSLLIAGELPAALVSAVCPCYRDPHASV